MSEVNYTPEQCNKSLIWLQDDEPIGRANCGCVLHRAYQPGDGSAWDDPAIVLCPLHAAAPELLAACKELVWIAEATHGAHDKVTAARAAISAAEGGEA